MRLVEEWQKSYKWISQQCFVAAGALTMAWGSLGSLQAVIPAKYVVWIAGGICALGFIGRLVDQSKPETPPQ